jgi:hypothetical protein
MVSDLSGFGYNAYMMHGSVSKSDDPDSKKSSDFRLIPISGHFWNDWYELCFQSFQPWCWNDVFFVRADPPCLTQALVSAIGAARSLKAIDSACDEL